jgi:hypothetical protein
METGIFENASSVCEMIRPRSPHFGIGAVAAVTAKWNHLTPNILEISARKPFGINFLGDVVCNSHQVRVKVKK